MYQMYQICLLWLFIDENVPPVLLIVLSIELYSAPKVCSVAHILLYVYMQRQ